METVKKHTGCRICGGPLTEVTDYGALPLANALAPTRADAINAQRYEQRLMHCPVCLLGQLSVVVAPEVLYSEYTYRSSVSAVFREHCSDLATTMGSEGRVRGRKVLDIAGNDGAMANALLTRGFERVYVMDPAQDDTEAGYLKIKKLWNEETAREFVEEHGRVDRVIAQNVVGHVDDIKGFFRAVRDSIEPYTGLFVVEVPCYKNMLETGAFDTVYHEHVSYWSVNAIAELATHTGFDIVNVKYFPEIHCGTLRFWMAPGTGLKHSGEHERKVEQKFFSGGFAEDFNASMMRQLRTAVRVMDAGRFAGVTASAKSNVILNMLFPVCPPAVLLDDTKSKIGKFAPGVGTEIRPLSEISDSWDGAFVLSRNLAVPLIKRLRAAGFRGVVASL